MGVDCVKNTKWEKPKKERHCKCGRDLMTQQDVFFAFFWDMKIRQNKRGEKWKGRNKKQQQPLPNNNHNPK